MPRPDVLLVPYAYANTLGGWAVIKALDPQKVILLHMPERTDDTLGLWPAVEAVTAGTTADFFCIPQIGQTVTVPD